MIPCLLAVVLATVNPLLPEELLDRHREAMGGQERLAHPDSLYIRYRLTTGDRTGQLESWSQGPNRQLTILQLPEGIHREGSDGRRKWSLSPAGQLTVEDEAIPARSLPTVLPEFRYLFPHPSVELEYLGPKDRPGRTEHLLEIRESGEPPRTLRIDPESYRISRIETRRRGRNVVVELQDYRPVEGIPFPHRRVQTSPDSPGAPLVLEVAEIVLDGPPPPEGFAPPGRQRPGGLRFEGETARVTLPLEPGVEHPLIRASIGSGAPMLFLLDSGSAVNVLHRSLARELGLQPEAEGLPEGGAELPRLVSMEPVSIRLAGLELVDQALFSADLEVFREALDRPLAGILGAPVFQRLILRFDPADRTVELIHPDRFRPPSEAVVLEGRLEGGILAVPARLDGQHQGHLKVDTGSNGALRLHGPFAANAGYGRDAPRRRPVEVVHLEGRSSWQEVRCGALELGSLRLEEVPTLLPGMREGIALLTDELGTLGMGVLSRFRTTFDAHQHRLLLERLPGWDRPWPVDRSGLLLRAGPEGIVVETVLPGSPAESKVLAGDRLVRLQGHSLEGTELPTVRSILTGPPGTRIRLKLERDGRLRKARFRLEDPR